MCNIVGVHVHSPEPFLSQVLCLIQDLINLSLLVDVVITQAWIQLNKEQQRKISHDCKYQQFQTKTDGQIQVPTQHFFLFQ